MDTSKTPQLEHQKFRAFKIWYSDSIYVGYSYEDWKNAPSDDVQVVMIYFKKQDALGRPTRLYSSGCDYYGLTFALNFYSHFDDITKVKGHILYGKYMNYDKLLELEQQAFNDYGENWLAPSTDLEYIEKNRGKS